MHMTVNLICACVNPLSWGALRSAPTLAFCRTSDPLDTVLPWFCWSPRDQKLARSTQATPTAAATRGRKAGLRQSPRCPAADPLWDPGHPVRRVSAFLRGPFSVGRSPAQRRMLSRTVLSADLGSPLNVPPGSRPGPGDLGGPRAGPLRLLSDTQRPARNRNCSLCSPYTTELHGARARDPSTQQSDDPREAGSSDGKPTVRRRRRSVVACPPAATVFCTSLEDSFAFNP